MTEIPFDLVRRAPAPHIAHLVAGISFYSEGACGPVAYRHAAPLVFPLIVNMGRPFRIALERTPDRGDDRDNEYGRQVGDRAGRRTDTVYLAVEDPDTLCARVKVSAAPIETERRETDCGSRDFAARDPEGGLWIFGTYWPKVGEEPVEA